MIIMPIPTVLAFNGVIMEEWRDIVGFEGLYKVSNFGNIMTVKTGKIKKPTCDKKDNRLAVLLWKENKCKLIRVHRAVIIAFKGAAPEGMECCHNDGNNQNNHIDNLRWDTPQNNQLDRIKHGTSNRGERCAASKLTVEQVFEIREDNRPHKEIAAQYNIRQSQVSRIKNRLRWSHI